MRGTTWPFSPPQGATRQPVENALRTAMTLAPNWFKPHWALANLLEITDRRAEARREALRASFLDADKDPEVARTLLQITRKTP